MKIKSQVILFGAISFIVNVVLLSPNLVFGLGSWMGNLLLSFVALSLYRRLFTNLKIPKVNVQKDLRDLFITGLIIICVTMPFKVFFK